MQCAGHGFFRREKDKVADEPITRGRAITWTVIFFVLAVIVNLIGLKMSVKPSFGKLLLGTGLYTAVFFVCWAMGTKADMEELKKGVVDGLRALIEPAPFLILVVIILEILIFFLGWPWFWRTLAPLACGIIAGTRWAKSEIPEEPVPSKKKDGPSIDVWKP
jgi:hypothetical protein